MIRARLAEFGAALGLLTRLPAGWLPQPTDFGAALARSVWCWPLIGAALGALGGLVQTALTALGLPPGLAACWALAAMLMASGALHEDGLADTADGFGGGHSRARKLDIMRDSRIGSYGVLALILSLGLRGAALASLAHPLAAMAVAAGLGRLALLGPLMALPPARSDGLSAGLGRPGAVPAFLALALMAALGLALLPAGLALGATLAALLAATLVTMLARRQIGGQTGDVLGAAAVLAESAALSVLTLAG
ncbi:adenosylcobinamide-GDP ribazoletransferase [Pseudoroseomonas globiformis]|uniref:Adenosylcobinamide-GDP ribazoletransferase n=1 Tax=Teichococcus globiformis TaxID=2307229 RepID=A0ABV7FTP1_9PROT